MKPNNFVEMVGWDRAILIVEKALHIGMFKFLHIGNVNSDDLEFLVESKKLLTQYGRDKSNFIASYCQDRQLDHYLSDVYAMAEGFFNKAISDVDSCNCDNEGPKC